MLECNVQTRLNVLHSSVKNLVIFLVGGLGKV